MSARKDKENSSFVPSPDRPNQWAREVVVNNDISNPVYVEVATVPVSGETIIKDQGGDKLEVNADGSINISNSDLTAIKTAVELLDNIVSGSEAQVDVVTLPGTVEADLTAIKAAVEILDNAISGSEMQVDIIAPLPAGTNTIGKAQIEGATDNTAIGNLSDELKANARLYDSIHGQYARFTNTSILKTATETIIGDFRFDQTSVPEKFDATYVGSGTWDIVATGQTGLELKVYNSGDSIKLTSKEYLIYQSGRGINMRISVIPSDHTTVGVKREWGLICAAELNGTYLRLQDGTLSWVIAYNGTYEVISSANWDVPFSWDGVGKIFEVSMLWLGVGDIGLYINHKLHHLWVYADSAQATNKTFSLATPDLRIYLYLENVSNNSLATTQYGCAAGSVEGANNARRLDVEPEPNDLATVTKAAIIGLDPEDDDGYHQAYVSDDRELHVYNRMNILQYKELIYSLNAIQREMRETKELIGKIFEEEPKKGDDI